MKKLLILILFFAPFVAQAQVTGLELPYGIKVLDTLATDAWYGPYPNIDSALSHVPSAVRKNRTVKIDTLEYWWRDGNADEDLIVKTSPGGVDIEVVMDSIAHAVAQAASSYWKVDGTTTINGFTHVVVDNEVYMSTGSFSDTHGYIDLYSNSPYKSVALGYYKAGGAEQAAFSFGNDYTYGDGVFFHDSRNATTGIEYSGDYSSGYTDRSLVDKGFVITTVTNAVDTIPRGPSITYGDAGTVPIVNATEDDFDYTSYKLPLTDGTNGQVLKTDGSGNVTWQDESGGGDVAELNRLHLPGVKVVIDGERVELSGSDVDEMTNLVSGVGDVEDVSGRNKPTILNNELNGYDVVDFNGSDNEILAIPAIAGIKEYTIYVVFKADVTTGNRSIVSNVQNSGGSFLSQGFNVLVNSNTITVTNRDGSGNQLKQFAFTETSNWHTLTLKFKSVGTGTSEMVVKLDGEEKLKFKNLNPINPSVDNIYLGSNLGGTPNSFDGKLAEFILTDEFHSADHEVSVYSYLNNKYGFTLPEILLENDTYSSSIDNITNLFVRSAFKPEPRQPLAVIMHGWSESATDFNDETLRRFADYGYFVASIGMRGRNGASGSRDASARELYDIYDGIEYIKQRYAGFVDPDRIVLVGYSGGGGNVLGMISKFPDLATLAVDFFGISDYGYDPTYGWYINASRQSDLEASIGDDPTDAPNEYKARYHIKSASNHKGKLRIYHDASDGAVQVENSDLLEDQLIADGFTNYVYKRSTSSDAQRWLHGLPNADNANGATNIKAETTFMPEGKILPLPCILDTGTFVVAGYLKTKKFEIWLGNGTESEDGKNRVAILQYDYANNFYTLTPDIDAPETDLTYRFIDAVGRTSSGTISTETSFIPVLKYLAVSDSATLPAATLIGTDPGEDAILFWDDSESETRYLGIGSGLSISGGDLVATGGVGGLTANRVLVSDGSGDLVVSDVTTTELNVLDGITSSTAELNILDGVTATASELNTLDGITATVTELNYTDGVTSNIQTQLDGKQTITPTASTGTAVAFDTNRSYCTSASPCTGNITFNSSGAVVGQMATMIHNDSSAPTFGSEFIILSGAYVTSEDNYIMFFLRESGKVWVTISQEQ